MLTLFSKPNQTLLSKVKEINVNSYLQVSSKQYNVLILKEVFFYSCFLIFFQFKCDLHPNVFNSLTKKWA
jgi:hypothetical protein